MRSMLEVVGDQVSAIDFKRVDHIVAEITQHAEHNERRLNEHHKWLKSLPSLEALQQLAVLPLEKLQLAANLPLTQLASLPLDAMTDVPVLFDQFKELEEVIKMLQESARHTERCSQLLDALPLSRLSEFSAMPIKAVQQFAKLPLKKLEWLAALPSTENMQALVTLPLENVQQLAALPPQRMEALLSLVSKRAEQDFANKTEQADAMKAKIAEVEQQLTAQAHELESAMKQMQTAHAFGASTQKQISEQVEELHASLPSDLTKLGILSEAVAKLEERMVGHMGHHRSMEERDETVNEKIAQIRATVKSNALVV